MHSDGFNKTENINKFNYFARVMRLIIFPILFLIFMESPAQIVVDKSKSIRFLALGDSYTIGESVSEDERWPELLAASLRTKGVQIEKPKIIATTGWRTDQLKQAILSSGTTDDYDLVSLLIGVNNQYQKKSPESYEPEFRELLEMAIKKAGGRKERVFVVSIPDYGHTPFGQARQIEISEDLDEFNEVNKEITIESGIAYFNITEISREGLRDPELVATDRLHPSGKMYRLWVEEILKGFLVR